MSLQLQTFNSVHDYLDALFEGKNPSKESVVLAKKQYWKEYNLNLIRKRRNQNHEFSVSFSKSEFKMIQDRLEKNEAVAKFIRRIVLHHLNDRVTSIQQFDTAVIEQQLFLIAEYLRELIEDGSILQKDNMKAFEIKILRLQHKIENQFDN